MKRKTSEEILKDQGMEQVNIYDIMYPDRKQNQRKMKNEVIVTNVKRRMGGKNDARD